MAEQAGACQGELMTAPSRRTRARLVGALFLAAMLLYGVGNGIVETHVIAGTSLMLANSVAVVLIAALMFPILVRHHRVIAFAYVASRVIEAASLALGVLSLASHGSNH